MEYPVDASVKRWFDALVSTELALPGVNYGAQRVAVPIENLGQTVGPLGPTNFDPIEIAWDINGMQGNNFYEKIYDTLQSREATDRLSPLIGKLIFEVQGQAKSVSIEVGTGFAIGLSVDRLSTEVKFKLCDQKANCIPITARRDGGTTQVTVEKIVDRNNVPLPAASTNFEARWPAWAGGSAREYSDWLRRRWGAETTYIGNSTSSCRGYLLACVGITDTSLLVCKLYCQ
jgi:hypothetical protein